MENTKGDLIAVLAAQGHAPEFRVADSGPPHARTFSAEVWTGGQLLGQGSGGSKREAERVAAAQALAELREDAAQGRKKASRPVVQPTRPISTQSIPTQPVPLHPAVLAEALAVADSRAAQGTPLAEVARQAAELYRDLLAELGHSPEGGA